MHTKAVASATNFSYPTTADTWVNALDRRLKGNLLINGAMQVWQRGTSFVAGGTKLYTADRWAFVRGGAVAGATLSRQTGTTAQYAARAQRDNLNAATNSVLYYQPLETVDCLGLVGFPVILKFRAKCGANFSATSSLLTVNVYSGTGTDQDPIIGGYTGVNVFVNENKTLTTSQQTFETTSVVIPAGATELSVIFSFVPTGTAGANDWFEVEEVQLVIGDYAGNYPNRPFAEELANCQRYYEKSYDLATAPATSTTSGCVSWVARTADQLDRPSVRYNTRKRSATPTVTIRSTTGASNFVRNITGAADVAASTDTTGESDFVAKLTANAVVANVYSFQWTAEAEL